MPHVRLGSGQATSQLRKHGIDFADAERMFRGFTLTAEDDREPYGEQRFLTLGMLEDQVVSVAHTERGGRIRIISIRKATNMKRATTSRKSLTKLALLRKKSDATIVHDGDAPGWTPEMFARSVARRGLKAAPKKALLSLRVDSDVIGWFKGQGAGYQSRMNALLRAYMEAHK